MRLLQYRSENGRRRVIAADADGNFYLRGINTVAELATEAISNGKSLAEIIEACDTEENVDIAAELAAGRIIAPIDHADPAHLLMTGTGLTHLGSAESRDKMHRAAAAGGAQTDSMRMFLQGLSDGKPPAGQVGVQPEWFYKGDGSALVGPEQPLIRPDFALDAGEEPEVAGIYMIGPDGTPFRLGLALANEFSDHVTERHNYLWLAHSKLRPAALGPELLVGPPPANVEGMSRIRRDGKILWEKPFLSGEQNMSHSLDNLEWHHFKYPQFRRPGDIHVHFFGTGTLSFADGIQTMPGDVFEITASPFTLPLRNALQPGEDYAVTVRQL